MAQKPKKFSSGYFVYSFNGLRVAVLISNTSVSKIRRGQRKIDQSDSFHLYFRQSYKILQTQFEAGDLCSKHMIQLYTRRTALQFEIECGKSIELVTRYLATNTLARNSGYFFIAILMTRARAFESTVSSQSH